MTRKVAPPLHVLPLCAGDCLPAKGKGSCSKGFRLMIAIIDYGMGNLRSVNNAFGKIGLKSEVTSDPARVAQATHIVLPGVGAFSDCMEQLRKTGLVPSIIEGIRGGKPFLGICLGFQLLMTRSEEFGIHQGLDIIRGEVKRFPAGGPKVPHIGWNQVEYREDCPLFAGISQGAYFYFDHSYFVLPEKTSDVASWTDYCLRFASSIWRGNVFATQFHPEKSQSVGLKLLENFGAQH